MASWLKKITKSFQSVDSRGWFPVIRESFAGAWQKNIEVNADSVLAYHAVFACTTLISADISKMRCRLVKEDADGIWSEGDRQKFPVIKKPNDFQNRIQFWENWINSKLVRGNTYVLKRRNNKQQVIALYILAPDRVRPLVSESGAVYYELMTDNLSGLKQTVTVPASEIIHDRFNCLFHPLVGLSPIFACGLAATQGLKIQNNSAIFFQNLSRPSGILSAPGAISDETAARLKVDWEAGYSGDNIGKVAVLGDDLKYYPLAMTPEEAQMVDQLKWTAEVVCSTYHVPPYMVGVGAAPTYNNIEALNQQYYNQCLQKLIEDAEECLDEGLEAADGEGFEFDLDGLLRMDTSALYKANSEGVKGGWYKPNEARKRVNLKPVAGGDTPYLQQQNYSLDALSKRDNGADPFKKESATPALPAPSAAELSAAASEERAAAKAVDLLGMIDKAFKEAANEII